MLDHIGIPVSDYPRSKRFYETALAPLGYGLVMEVTPDITGNGSSHCGFGGDHRPQLWISAGGTGDAGGIRVHLALSAASRTAVAAFHQAAIHAGGRDNGAPGLRPHYHPDYYGAFVLDPDGHNIEAVCHAPEA